MYIETDWVAFMADAEPSDRTGNIFTGLPDMSGVAGVSLSAATDQSVLCPSPGQNVLLGAKCSKMTSNVPSWRQTHQVGAKRGELAPNVGSWRQRSRELISKGGQLISKLRDLWEL
jgi:hypothetical protein